MCERRGGLLFLKINQSPLQFSSHCALRVDPLLDQRGPSSMAYRCSKASHSPHSAVMRRAGQSSHIFDSSMESDVPPRSGSRWWEAVFRDHNFCGVHMACPHELCWGLVCSGVLGISGGSTTRSMCSTRHVAVYLQNA